MKQNYYFTFGVGDEENAYKYVKISGTDDSAREKMFKNFGPKWAFQYSEEKFLELRKNGRFINLTELKII